jgi:hypothetical protein
MSKKRHCRTQENVQNLFRCVPSSMLHCRKKSSAYYYQVLLFKCRRRIHTTSIVGYCFSDPEPRTVNKDPKLNISFYGLLESNNMSVWF